MVKIVLILIAFLLLASPTYALTTYTQSTETSCQGTICNLIVYSGIRYVYEDNQWKTVETVKSLKGKGFEAVIISDDKVNSIEVIDFNLTTLIFKVSTKDDKNLGLEVPIKIDEKTNYTYKPLAKDVKSPIQIIKVDNTLDHNYSFGFNSTTIILNETNTGNIGDTMSLGFGSTSNYGADARLIIRAEGRVFLLWNLSSIPAGNTITSATMSLFLHAPFTDSRNHTVYNTSLNLNVSTTAWCEGNGGTDGSPGCEVRWDNKPQPAVFQSSAMTGTTPASWINWTVTEAAKTSYANATNKNMALRVNDIYEHTEYCEGNGGCVGNSTVYCSKENSTASCRPKLTIVYDTAAVTTPTSISLLMNGTGGNISGVYPITLNASATVNVTGLFVELYRNGTLVRNTTTNSENVTLLGAGLYNITAYYPGNATYSSSSVTFWLNESSLTQTLTLTNNTSLSGVYPYPLLLTGNGNNTTAGMFRNGSSISNPYDTLLAAGNYLFTWNTSGNQNYSSATISKTVTISPNPNIDTFCVNANGTTYCNVNAGGCYDGGSGILDVQQRGSYGVPINISWTAAGGTKKIWLDSTDITANNNLFVAYPIGFYLLKANASDGNYTYNCSQVELNISKANPNLAITFNVSSPVVAGTPILINCSSPSQITPNMYNSTNSITIPYVFSTTGLNGVHNFTCNTTGNENYTSGTASNSVTVALAGSFIISGVYDENNLTSLRFDAQIFNSSFSTSVTNVTSYNNNSVGGDVTIVISANGYGTRRYFASVSNGIYNMTGYLVATENGQNVQFTVKDYFDLLISGADMTFESLVPTWANVSMVQSDTSGKAVVFLNPSANYKVTVTKTGYARKEFNLNPALASYTVYMTSNNQPGGNAFWNYYDSISGVCNYNNTTRNLFCTWNDTSTVMDSVSLSVTSTAGTSTSVLCTNTSTASSGNFTCNFGSMANKKYDWMMTSNFAGTTISLSSGSWKDSSSPSAGSGGIFLTMLIIIAAASIGIAMGSPVIVVVMTVLGVGISGAAGFLDLTGAMAGLLVGLAVAGGILIFKMK